MTKKLILAIDQGTTSSRSVVFDANGNSLFSAQQEFEQIFPHDGWVEHDPEAIWESVSQTCQVVINDSKESGEISTIGITNQRETTVVWDKRTGKAIYNAIVWQDRRTEPLCQSLRQSGHDQHVSSTTGLLLDPYFSASKVNWILNNVEGAMADAKNGHLLFGTIDSYLIYRLTEGEEHVTDVTNASRTMLYNIHKQQWDNSLLELFDIPESMLPTVLDCDSTFGSATAFFSPGISINGVLGDQHAATVGQACFEPGMIKSTYGTGNFVMLNTGNQAIASSSNLVTTIAYRINGKTNYALEGSVFIAGAVVQWLRDKLGVLEHAADSEAIARSIDDDSSVVMVPAFTGLGAPHWNANARGAIFGLTRNTGYEHIVAAALESICFQSNDLVNAMRSDGATITSLRVDGGMCANNWVMQMLADILELPVQRPQNIETTVFGAAVVAALGAGLIDSIEQITDLWQLDQEFTPTMENKIRAGKLDHWNKAVSRVKDYST